MVQKTRESRTVSARGNVNFAALAECLLDGRRFAYRKLAKMDKLSIVKG
jgi:hypothetical protein